MKAWYKACLSAALLGIALSLISVEVLAASTGDVLIRGRVINVSPNVDSDDVITGADSPVDVDPATTIEVDFTYMLSPNLGLELILATTKHDISAKGDISDLGKVAETGVLPPTLTLQYHFSPSSNVRPYAGAGLNYTLFYNEDSGALDNDLGVTDSKLSLDPSFGLAVQAGVDVDINTDWYFNVDVKYIQIKTEASLESVAAGIDSSFDVEINPWVFGIGVGKVF